MTPDGWELKKGDTLFKLGGGHAPRDIEFDDSGDTLFLKVDDFNAPSNQNGITSSNLRFFADDQSITVRIYDPGTLVFPKRGAAIFKNRVQALTRPATVDSNLMCLAATNVDAKFFRHHLLFCGIHEIADTSSVPQINNKHLYPRAFVVPPIAEQRKIAAVLGSVDEAIGATRAVIEQTRRVKQGLLQQLLTRGIGHTRFKQTEIGEIPEAWEVVTTGHICRSIVPGRNKPKVFDGNIPWITIPDISGLYIGSSKKCLAVTREEIKRANGKTIPAGTVVMTCVGKFGISTIAECEVVINQQLHGFVCGDRIDPLFLCFVLQTKEREMLSMAGQTTIPYLNRGKCESIAVPLPRLDEQKAIAGKVRSVVNAEIESQKLLDLAFAVKRGLMQDLLTGRVRVGV